MERFENHVLFVSPLATLAFKQSVVGDTGLKTGWVRGAGTGRGGVGRGGRGLLRTSLIELELELIQPHMTQKQVLWGEVDARALRV